MKTLRTLFVIAVAILGFATSSLAQSSSSATTTASGTIMKAITITEVTPLEFGKIAVGSSAGSVTIAIDGDISYSTVSGVSGITPTAASFSVTGDVSASFNFTIPTSLTLQTGSGGAGKTMSLGTFVSDPTSTGGTGSTSLDGSGNATINIGATLTVSSNQTPGLYTNTTPFTVTVDYN